VTHHLRGRYGPAVGLALLGLCPNVVLQTVFFLLNSSVASDLGTSSTTLQVSESIASAAYATGAVLGAQLAQRFGQRRLFLTYQAVFVVGSLVTAVAPGLAGFSVGRVLQGLAAGAMLISALPPLIARFGADRLPVTAVVVNLGIFGASALGPVIGGLSAGSGSWRLLFVASAVLGAVGWLTALVGYAEIDPARPDTPVDRSALALTVVATVTMFLGASRLAGDSAGSPAVLVPLAVGLLAVVLLLVVESRKGDPALMPVRALSTQLPVTGMLVSSIGGAVFVVGVALVQLQVTEVTGRSPATVAALLWPGLVGVAVAAVLFGLVLRGRFVPVLVDAGLVALVVAVVLLLAGGATASDTVLRVVVLLLGLGAGATVSPGLFLVGWSLPAAALGRAFALVQLVRSTVTYATAPVVLHVAMAAGSLAAGVRTALVVTLVVVGATLLAALVIPFLSGARLRAPDLEDWLDGGRALPSPRTAVHARVGATDEEAEPLVPRRLRRR
jgi:MFS family permease